MHFLFNLFLLICLTLPLVAKASTDAKAISEKVEAQAAAGLEADAATIPLSDDVLIFSGDATSEDIVKVVDYESLNTRSVLQAGSQVNTQAQMRAAMAAYHLAMFGELRELREQLIEETSYITMFVDENPDNAPIDVIVKLNELDELLYGPKYKPANPPFALASSTTLNAAPHAPSQLGDPCQSAAGNGASLGVAPLGAVYTNACDGESTAELADCIKQTLARINAEPKGASCASTQVAQPTVLPDRNKLAEVSTTKNNTSTAMSCPTTPPAALAENNFTKIIAGTRAERQQRSLVKNTSTTAYAGVTPLPLPSVLNNNWAAETLNYALPWLFKNANANTTFRAEASNSAVTSVDIAAEDDFKNALDLADFASVTGAQNRANQGGKALEDLGKMAESLAAETAKISESIEKIANLPRS